MANSEPRDGNKWHVEYKLHMTQVPFSGGSVNARGLNRLELGEDPDTGKPLTAKLWFRPDLLEKIFGACKVCFVPMSACFGNDDPRKGNKDGKRTTAAAANAAAQERKKLDMDEMRDETMKACVERRLFLLPFPSSIVSGI